MARQSKKNDNDSVVSEKYKEFAALSVNVKTEDLMRKVFLNYSFDISCTISFKVN